MEDDDVAAVVDGSEYHLLNAVAEGGGGRSLGCEVKHCTVEPVYNGPALSGHPLLSGQFLKSRCYLY